ncbi:hypothetical protein KBZ21_39850, partial [Streptomyces sp. A73]|nr:hypothetical protein [Streptomyces sp. A73]
KRAERRCRRFGGAWADVMRLALWVRDGEPPERSRRIECVWRDTANFRAHDGCHCGVVPIFRGQTFELSDKAREWERLYQEYA